MSIKEINNLLYLRETNNKILIKVATNQLIIKKRLMSLKNRTMKDNTTAKVIKHNFPQHKDKCYCQMECQCKTNTGTETLNSKHKFIRSNLPNVRFIDSHNNFQPNLDNYKYDSLINTRKYPLIFRKSREDKCGYNNLIFTTRRKHYECGGQRESLTNETSPCEDFTISEDNIYNYDQSKIDEISKFRSQNSNECISILNKYSHKKMLEKRDINNIDHVCTHRFKLNERLFPEPIIKNGQGQSLCSICKKISKHLIQEKIVPLTVKNRILKENETCLDKNSIKTIPKLILEVQTNEKDHKLNESLNVKSSKSSTISINKKRFSDINLKVFKEIQMPTNSLALRHQKRY